MDHILVICFMYESLGGALAMLYGGALIYVTSFISYLILFSFPFMYCFLNGCGYNTEFLLPKEYCFVTSNIFAYKRLTGVVYTPYQQHVIKVSLSIYPHQIGGGYGSRTHKAFTLDGLANRSLTIRGNPPYKFIKNLPNSTNAGIDSQKKHPKKKYRVLHIHCGIPPSS